jgi:uncharacterized protein YggE
MKWFYLALLVPTLALATEQHEGVQVTGSCDIKVVPDRGSVSFTAENQSKQQTEAVAKTNNQMNDLKTKITALKLAGVEFKTTNYQVTPIREWEKEKMVDKGIRASMTLEVTTSDIERLGESLVEASKAGLTNIGSMNLYLSIEKSQAEYLKCLDVASKDARKKAEQLANKLGFKVGDVMSVIESSAAMPGPTPYPERTMMKSAMRDAAPVSVDAGSQNFSTTIQVTFKIK